MIDKRNSLYSLVELMRQKAPAYFGLLAAGSESQFDEALDAMLEGAVSHLETNSRNFLRLDEAGLSGVLAAWLSMPGLTVTQEAHFNGHVDLTIMADYCMPARKRLAEAKIYNGPAYHIAGLKQLCEHHSDGCVGVWLRDISEAQQSIFPAICREIVASEQHLGFDAEVEIGKGTGMCPDVGRKCLRADPFLNLRGRLLTELDILGSKEIVLIRFAADAVQRPHQ